MRPFVIVVLLLGACSSPGPEALVGTWDLALGGDDAGAVVDEFVSEGLIESADSVSTRLGFDGEAWWQGWVFDGELFLLHGVPEGDGGSYVVDGETVVLDNGDIRGTFAWDVDGDGLTLAWLEQCQAFETTKGAGVKVREIKCTDDRATLARWDPNVLNVMEHTFTRSGDDADY